MGSVAILVSMMKVLAIFIFGLVAFVANVDANVCPSGWSDFFGKCILYKRKGFNYDDAARFCRSVGGKLYEPQSKLREEAIRAWAVAQGPAPGTIYGPWIGINDKTTEGTFVFNSGGTPPFFKWSTGQPDNLGNEDCVHFFNPPIPNGLWNDWFCTKELGALCERPAKKNCDCCEKMRAVLDECCDDDQHDGPIIAEPEPVGDDVADIRA